MMGKHLYGSLPLQMGDMLQGPQWIPEIMDSIKPALYSVFSCTYIYFPASFWHIRIASITTPALWGGY